MKNKIYHNRSAFHNYEIIKIIEAGIVLTGDEVKSIRENGVSFEGCYAVIENNEAWLNKLYIAEYKNNSNHVPYDPTRKRKLLLHHNQIKELLIESKPKGFTLIPLEIYFLGNKRTLIKVELALVKGKKNYDKRQAEKERQFKKEINEL